MRIEVNRTTMVDFAQCFSLLCTFNWFLSTTRTCRATFYFLWFGGSWCVFSPDFEVEAFFQSIISSFFHHPSSTAAVLNHWSLGENNRVSSSGEVFCFVCFSTSITRSGDVHLFVWMTHDSLLLEREKLCLAELHLDVDKEWQLFCNKLPGWWCYFYNYVPSKHSKDASKQVRNNNN